MRRLSNWSGSSAARETLGMEAASQRTLRRYAIPSFGGPCTRGSDELRAAPQAAAHNAPAQRARAVPLLSATNAGWGAS